MDGRRKAFYLFTEFVNILAVKAGQCYTGMTGEKVIGAGVREASGAECKFSAARVTSFDFTPEGLVGRMVLGLIDQKEALDSACAMANQFSCPPPKTLDKTAIDFLSEFMSAVIGASAIEMEGLGFFPQHDALDSLESDAFEHEKPAAAESYDIVINLPFSKVTLRVDFEAWTLRWFGLKPRVLIVDDSPVIRAFLNKVVTSMKMDPLEVGDGQDAVEKFISYHPHLTMMDLVMPKMGGLEAIEAIKKFAPWARFIILTSSARADQVLKARKLGVINYILKPPQAPVVIDRITKVLNLKKSPEPVRK